MNPLQKVKQLLPLIILFALLSLLWRELFSATPGTLPSALIGEPIPHFSLVALQQNENANKIKLFSTNDLHDKKVVLLNYWASWCGACAMEHSMLMTIKQQYNIPIYGIDYKDEPDTARRYLAKHGNPYVLVGSDITGDVAIDFGVYGTPETYIIAKGRIVYRRVGAIDQDTWDTELYPLIQKYQQEK
jgi:cytochrome c biogenesis protein CcmG/thiol:disulfide interchange protein DsbE